MSTLALIYFLLGVFGICAGAGMLFILREREGRFASFLRYASGALIALSCYVLYAGEKSKIIGLFDLLLYSLILGWLTRFAARYFASPRDSWHIRGANVASGAALGKKLRKQQIEARFTVGEIPVPVDLETRGFLFAGSPGTGKSQAITNALDALHYDNAVGVIADASGIYASRYYAGNRDVIINPFDARSAKWSPLAELESVADIPALAKSMIPDAEGNAAEWNNYAQTALEAILLHCFESGASNQVIFELAAIAPVERLREVFAGTPAAPLVAEGNERMWGSVRAIIASYLKAYQYLDPDVGASNGFSIRKHIVESRPGWIFLTYQQQHRDALKSLIGACIDIAARAVLSLPPDLNRRVVFAIDEMPLLGKVQSIVDLATNGRKHGAVIFAGLQTIAQIRETYGRETAQTLLACLGSWLVLRVADAETADYMSRYLGEEEKIRIVRTESKSNAALGNSSVSESHQYAQQRIVLPSELQNLPDMVGYFNLAGPLPTALVRLHYAPERKVADAFVRAEVKPRSTVRSDAAAKKPAPENKAEQAARETSARDDFV